MPIFFAAIVETLLVVTKPDSSIQKPAAIHITKKPQIRNEKVLKMYSTSALTSANAYELKKQKNIVEKTKIFLNINYP